ncbi:MAG: anaerobic ribonucleoside-triphosphate reductase activating protein, partial [Erysipelotrichaceae bacterium]|nr:anaerobic ribonucleoside-triphosphate reductase activating protein [Erysipelotrichaceae bacterium]
MKIRLYGTVNDSIVDGPGLRYTIFTQGCPHHCFGCHNPDSHDFHGGYEEDTHNIIEEILDNPLLDGVTLSGGEPMMQPLPLIEIIHKIKEHHLHIMIYSGYTYEEILQLGENQKLLLSLCDTLVDGRFDMSKRSLELLYKGSSNQRIINIQGSLKNNRIMIQEISEYGELL